MRRQPRRRHGHLVFARGCCGNVCWRCFGRLAAPLSRQVDARRADERPGDRRTRHRRRPQMVGADQTGEDGQRQDHERRFAAVQGLQQVRAHVGESGVFVTLPDRTRHHIESAVLQTRLSELVGESVTLAPESDVSHFDDGSVVLSRAPQSKHSGKAGGSTTTNPDSARLWSSAAWKASKRSGGSSGGCASAPPHHQ